MIINSIAFPNKQGLTGDWIDEPTRQQIEKGFDREWARMGAVAAVRYVTREHETTSTTDQSATQAIFDIGIDSHDLIPDENGEFAEHPYAFIHRRTIHPDGKDGMLVWDPDNTSNISIEIEDTGDAIWDLRPKHSVPIPFAIDFMYRFLTEGYTGDDLTWDG